MILQFDENGSLIGSITSVGYPAPQETLDLALTTAASVEDVPPFEPRYWHRTGEGLRIRPRLDLTTREKSESGGKLFVIEGIPAGAMVRVTGPDSGELEADGEAVELLFQQPGGYRVTVMAEPYQPQEFDVRAEAAHGTA
ncbi:hypothetical protein [Microvirga sp. Mcv34]|uniref:hypothetical protein n=1 Tax=Microvirga sp. Mcv34 TaxID=2926016 RepID=UPI0021C98293|nr:hypothetical protein [Microvirga sp. Mcv34]